MEFDIFGRKRIKSMSQELFLKDKEISSLKRENTDLRDCLSDTENALKNIIAVKETVPEDCIPGEYCRSCEFVKPFRYRNYVYNTYKSNIQGYYCGKGESCKNFIQKEIEE